MTSIESMPAAMREQMRKARSEIDQKRLDAAASTLATLLASAPNCVPALAMRGFVAQMQGHPERAIDYLQKAVALRPDDAGLYAGFGVSLFDAGNIAGAIVALRRACALAPDAAGNWYNLGKALKLEVQMPDAIAALERALQLDPAHVTARITLADAEASVGHTDAAVAHLRRVLTGHPGQAHAWYALANLKVVPFAPADAQALRDQFEQPAKPAEDRVLLGFALARALEDQGDYPASFKVLKRANQLERQRVTWDAMRHRAHVAAIQRTFAVPHASAANPEQGREVVFIASLPRSGSTLVEQILASHPDVEGANEITALSDVVVAESKRRAATFPAWVEQATAAEWQRLGAEYLARTARWRVRKPRFTDKNLASWKLTGTALAMLPAARVVIVHRDPLETCLACYRQWFSRNTAFAYDLDELAAYYEDFQHLTRFWLQRYPERVLDFEYEALLADPEREIRRLLDFCGLAFDPACLDFQHTQRTVVSSASAAQVRQPLQRSTARAPRYGHLLDGLRQRLQDAGLATS
ncbi:MAG TPA: sulfotransferase [Rhodanobacteraceae bacterium]